jgi:hypothetical protein
MKADILFLIGKRTTSYSEKPFVAYTRLIVRGKMAFLESV